MSGGGRLAKLEPLAFGRLSRVLAGLATLIGSLWVDWSGAGLLGGLALVFVGLSFLVGGLMANPGCELTALVNLLLPRRKRLHFL